MSEGPTLQDILGKDYDNEYPEEEEHCPTCHDTGRIVAADGYHEYLGYDYLPCPNCSKGVTYVP